MKTYIVANDFQIPFQHKSVTDLFLEFTAWLKPDGVVLAGDIVDGYNFSTFHKDPQNTASLGVEIKGAKWLLGGVRNRMPKTSKLFWLGGNHEDRHRRYMWANAPALADVLSFPKLFDLADFKCEWRDYGEVLELGYLLVTHGNYVRAHSAYTAKKNFEVYGRSVMTGHTHRLGIYYRRNTLGIHGAYENGCMCRFDMEYLNTPFPDWHHGLSVVHFEPKNGWFHVQQIPILSESVLFYGNKRIKVKRSD